MISIRPYCPEDQEGVILLWERVFPVSPPHNNPVRDIRTKRSVQPELFMVAEDAHQIVGTVMAGFDGHRGWVYYLGVDPDFRRQGIGTALMRRAEHKLAAMGCPKLNLQIRAHNREVQAFYEKLGYSVEDRISMGKILD
jgi:ribosomal protein S18 acetylase RimI-like enzyme